MITFPYEARALRVDQPLGTYYVTVLPARLLLDVAYSHAMTARLNPDGVGYTVDGTQRLSQPKRLDQITDYIDRFDAAFPNSIILAANFDAETGLIVDLEDDEADDDDDENTLTSPQTQGQGASAPTPQLDLRAWTVTEAADGCYHLRIPTADKLAAIIDGQHRLYGFADAKTERLDMDLICAVFLDLPKPFQASLFATINSTQKQVDKSLTYELFGYNLDEEPESRWTPDKLAVFLTRKLNTEAESPLRGRIVVAPKRDVGLMALNSATSWKVSTAVIVEGILKLISSNPKRDTNEMLTPPTKARAELRARYRDRSPLREAYLQTQDLILYTMVLNFLKACQQVFWTPAQEGSFIIKTVGVQALFDVLRRISAELYETKDIRVETFVRKLQPAGAIDFSQDVFRNASGSGRSLIRRAIEERLQR